MKKSRKTLALIAACLMLVVGVVGGTVAWLTATTGSVVNTFTCGDINITLAETTGTSYKILPGNNIAKDPTVTVSANSEDCILFVKVEEENWPTFTETNGTRKVRYEIADGWTALDTENHPGVYYRTVTSSESNQDFAVLKDNTITVSGNLTKVEVNSMTTAPTLTITAYAHQLATGNSENPTFDRATAWANLNPTT